MASDYKEQNNNGGNVNQASPSTPALVNINNNNVNNSKMNNNRNGSSI